MSPKCWFMGVTTYLWKSHWSFDLWIMIRLSHLSLCSCDFVGCFSERITWVNFFPWILFSNFGFMNLPSPEFPPTILCRIFFSICDCRNIPGFVNCVMKLNPFESFLHIRPGESLEEGSFHLLIITWSLILLSNFCQFHLVNWQVCLFVCLSVGPVRNPNPYS